MRTISNKFISFLCENNIIERNKQELYAYALEILLSSILHFLTTIVIGIVFRMLAECLLMFAVFSVVRRFAGGFHASTHLKCYFSSIAAIMLMLFLISVVKKWGNDLAFYVILIISDLTIWFASPIESQNKPLSYKEKKVYKAVSIALSSVITALAVMVYEFVAVNYGVSLCFGLTLVAIVLYTSLLHDLLSRIKNTEASK
ncbi:MAG: accessory gene regulator B family protein [Acutalibacteraceae bacterium]|nr:accessory gene regulator B family protein [Acutalibacteraceae bacterium]